MTDSPHFTPKCKQNRNEAQSVHQIGSHNFIVLETAIQVSKNIIMSTDPLRVGILGCAGIASKTALAIVNPATNCVVRAVASRSAEKAEVNY